MEITAIKDGSARIRVQSLPCRAPEIWRGLPCQHGSDVWSLGATVSHCTLLLQTELTSKLTTSLALLMLFGHLDKTIEGNTEAWCIAKIMRLVGPFGPPIDNETYKDEFELAEQLEAMLHPLGRMKLISREDWRTELEDIPDPPVPNDLLDFIETLLVLDPDRRPTAVEALLHPYLQAVV